MMTKQKIEGSTLFWVENRNGQNYLCTEFSDEDLYVRNIEERDLPFYTKLFGDKEVVQFFADRQPKDLEYMTGRYKEWNSRFLACQPHGGLSVIDRKTNELIGHVVAGKGGPGGGVSELAAAFMVHSQHKGIATKMLEIAVKVWAPEVRKIGLGEIKDSRFPDLEKAFKCFNGEALSRLDATYNPLNTVAGKILKKAGFVKAQTALCIGKLFDLRNTGLSFAKEGDLEKITNMFFDINVGRVGNQRYTCIDQDGDERTISFKAHFKVFMFHAEKDVSTIGI